MPALLNDPRFAVEFCEEGGVSPGTPCDGCINGGLEDQYIVEDPAVTAGTCADCSELNTLANRTLTRVSACIAEGPVFDVCGVPTQWTIDWNGSANQWELTDNAGGANVLYLISGPQDCSQTMTFTKDSVGAECDGWPATLDVVPE